MGLQGLGLFVLAWAAVLNLAVLDQPVHDYHFIRLVETPPVVNHEPAPVKQIPPPRVARVETPPADVLRVPPPVVQPKIAPEEMPVAPKVEIAATKPCRASARRAGHSTAVGEDPRFFHRQLGRAHHCGGPKERTDRRLWRSEWSSGA